MTAIAILSAALLACLPYNVAAFSVSQPLAVRPITAPRKSNIIQSATLDDEGVNTDNAQTRRSILQKGLLATTTALALPFTTTNNDVANAALGTLPEFADTNAIIQSLTIDVTDKSQYDETISFFTNAFDGMKVLRESGAKGSACGIGCGQG